MTSKNPKIAAIILAAGKGTRLKKKPENTNKVSLKLNGKPMISYTVDLLEKTGFDQIIAVVGYASESVKNALGSRVDYALQSNQDGTGAAVDCGLTALNKNIEYVLVLHGDDSAFYQPEILEKMIDVCKSKNLDMTFLTVIKADPFGIGRIIRDKRGVPQEIIEEKNASALERQIKEVNLGMYCFKRDFIEKFVKQIKFNPIANERYLTDIVAIAYQNNCKLDSVKIDTDEFWFGVNTDEQFEQAIKKMSQKHRK